MKKIKFNVDQHFYKPWRCGLRHTKIPMFAWLDQHVGAYNFYKEEREPIHGQGWRLQTLTPLGFIEFTDSVDEKTLLEFALRWQ